MLWVFFFFGMWNLCQKFVRSFQLNPVYYARFFINNFEEFCPESYVMSIMLEARTGLAIPAEPNPLFPK
jgi:hypothetical protein